MARVFVSHATEDLDLASEVFAWLRDKGHDLFFDRDLRAGLTLGEPWEPALYRQLREADAVVCLVTSAYLASVWCTAEVTVAITRGSRVLPVLAEAGVNHPLLTGIEYTDYIVDPELSRAKLAEALDRLDSGGGRGWVDGRSPYPGLRAFDTDMNRAFFGRRTEIVKLIERLRSPGESAERGLLVLTGPSGCGKSSLVRAGVLPAMVDEPGWWTLPAMLPGADPVGVLAGEIVRSAESLGLGWQLPQVLERMNRGQTSRLLDELLLAAPGSRRRLLIVIDQLEELLTVTGDVERERFVAVLLAAMAGSATLLATLRPEFLAPVLASDELGLLRPRSFLLRPLDREVLREVILGPADLAGLTVDPDLLTRLVTDTGSGDALPLLAFTLERLAALVPRGGQLSLARYEELGGVHGALTSQADQALMDATRVSGRSTDQVFEGLLRLVSVDDQGTPVRVRVPRDDLPAEVQHELEAFTVRRLLTKDTESTQPVIEVAHEAFLTAWLPLANAIARHGAALRSREAVETAARAWDDNRRSHDRLWEGGQLAAAISSLNEPALTSNLPTPSQAGSGSRWDLARRLRDVAAAVRRRWGPSRRLRAASATLSPRAHQFLVTSVRIDRRRRTIAISVLVVLLAAAVGFAVRAVDQQGVAQEQQRVATARQLLAQAKSLAPSDPRTAVSLVLAGSTLNPAPETDAALFDHLVGSPIAASLTGHTGAVASVAFSPDGRTLATGSDDDTVILWDVTDPTRPTRLGDRLTGHAGAVASLAFTPDGRTLATGSDDDTVILWDVTDPTRPTRLGDRLTGHAGAVASLAFTPDGRTLATGSGDTTVILWDVTDPTRPIRIGVLTGHTYGVYAVAFSPDGHTLATASNDTTVILWDVTDPTRPTRIGALTGHTYGVYSVAFSPDGHTLATGSDDNTAILWDVTDPTRPTRIGDALTGHRGAVRSVAFSPDGRTLATGSNDTMVILWDVTDPTRPDPIGDPLTDYHGAVYSSAFSPDSRTLATGSNNNDVTLWNVTDPARPARIGQPLTGHHGAVFAVAFSPDGRTLATGGNDGLVILWNLTDTTRPTQIGQPLSAPPSEPDKTTDGVYSLAFSSGGRILASGRQHGSVTLWDVTDPARPATIGQALAGHTATVTSVAFSRDGKLASGSLDDTVILWNLTAPTRPTRIGVPLAGHTAPVRSVAFSPDGRTLATASDDNTAILWDVTEPSRSTQIGDPLSGHTAPVLSVAFSPDGQTVATGSGDARVILWNVTDRSRPTRIGAPLTGHTGVVLTVAFSKDGHTLATGSYVSTADLWDLSGIAALRGTLRERACAVADQGLTPEQWGRYAPGLAYEKSCAGTASSSAAVGARNGNAVNGKVGIILPDTTSSARWETADRPFLEAGFKAAGVAYDIQNANGDASAMQAIADRMIAKGAKVLAIVNLDNDSGAKIERKAREQGVTIIDYDRLALGGSANYYVSFDNAEVGRLQGRGLDQCLGGGEKNIVYLDGPAGDWNATAFSRGAHSVLDGKPTDTVVAEQAVPKWDNQKAMTMYRQIFAQQGGAIDGVLAANDGLGNAVISVEKQNNMKIPVTGQDATVQGLQNILTGDQCMTVYKAVKKEADALSKVAITLLGGRIPQTTATVQDTIGNRQVPSILETPQAITKDNIKLVVDDGYVTAADLCKATDVALQPAVTAACAAAGVG